MAQLIPSEWKQLRDRFTSYLNGLNPDIDEMLPEDYFYDHEVVGDTTWYGTYRYLMVELMTLDEGGGSLLFVATRTEDINDISFASYTFDTITTVWVEEVSA